jgi:ABC-type Fe3+/spermidine/putrescine transport system ATPase subunit
VVLLHEGRVVQTGRPETLYDHPHNAWVARFLGLDNVFPARVLAGRRVSVPFGELVPADGTALPAPGTEGQVLIHPWGVHLDGGPVNGFDARLTRRTFHGSYFRLTLAVTGGALHVSRDAGQPLPESGDRVRGRIDPAAIRWLGEP